MLFSFSTNAFTDRSVFAAAAEIAAAGYRGVEILADRPHLYPASATEKELERLSGLLAGLDLAPANLNAHTTNGYYGRDFWEPLFEPSLANPDSLARGWRLSQIRRCLVMARILGSFHVSITSGRPAPGTSLARSLEILTESLLELAGDAAAERVRIGIGCEPGLLIENAVELANFLDRLPSPWIGADLDIGHTRVAGERLERVLDRLGGRISHIRLQDIRGRKHHHLIPGEGTMDFASIFRTLEKVGYAGFVTVDLPSCRDRPVEAAERSLRHLERFIPRDDPRTSPWANSPCAYSRRQGA